MEFEFEDLPEKVRIELLQICSKDSYNLSPKSLYLNILHSNGSTRILSRIFEVPDWIIEAIKKHK